MRDALKFLTDKSDIRVILLLLCIECSSRSVCDLLGSWYDAYFSVVS
jgi:hypothetical protein